MQKPSVEDIKHELNLRMRNGALRHFDKIGARTLLILQKQGLFDTDVEPLGEQSGVDLRVVVREPDAPDPWSARSSHFRADEVAVASIDYKLLFLKAVPLDVGLGRR